MERQKINISQYGIDVTLNCRTTVICAGNPKKEQYNKAKTLAENVNINPALLTRFDLIFILTKQEDNNFPLQIRSASTSKKQTQQTKKSTENESDLEKFLKKPDSNTTNLETISNIEIRQYIGYARNNIFPKITRPAYAILNEFYMKIYEKQDRSKNTPITTRQLYGLIRLAIARARVDLTDEVTIEHAKDIIELTRYSLKDIFPNTTLKSQKPIDTFFLSKNKQKNQLLEQMKQKNQQQYTMEEINEIKKTLKLTENTTKLVDNLNIEGHLLMIKPNVYKIINQ